MSNPRQKIRMRSFPLVMLSFVVGLASIIQASTTVATWQGDKEGAVSITFDDGLIYHFEVAWPMLHQRNLKATFYIPSNKLSYTWFTPYIDAIVADDQEIGSHSASHVDLTTLSNPALVNELQGSQIALQNYTGQDVASIAYPFGAFNPNVVAHTTDYYIAGRGVSSWFNKETGGISLNAKSPNLYTLYVISPHDNGAGDPNAIAYLNYAVDRAVSDNKWAIEMFHGIDEGYDAISSQVLSSHLNYLVTNEPNVWIAPVGMVSEYIYERDAASVTTFVQQSNLIQLDLSCGLDSRFNTPLTLLTECPAGWELLTIQVWQNGSLQPSEMVHKNNAYFIMYNALPDAGVIELYPTQAIHTITASAGENGSIDPSGEIYVSDGSDFDFVAEPSAGYELDQWFVDGSPVQTGGTLFTLRSITADHTVQVSFALKTYTITASSGPHGSIDPSGDVPGVYGSTYVFTAIPDVGYTVDQWFIDGQSVQDGGTSYDLSAIVAEQNIQVTFKPYSAMVALWQGGKEGAVSITFNNGWDSQYQNAFPALQSRGLKATFYTITSQISDPNVLLQLAADAQEIGSQAVDQNDLTQMTYEQRLYQLSESQLYLQQLTGQDVTTFAYPFGIYDANLISLVKDYYIAARTTDSLELNDPASSSVPEWFYELVVIGPHDNGEGDPNAIAYLKNSVDMTVMQNMWAIEIFHSIGISGGYDTVSNEAFGAHLDYLTANEPNVWVAPVGTIAEYLTERDNAVITPLISESGMVRFDLQCGLNSLFDTPLTLLTECPPGWDSATVYVQQGDVEKNADIVTRNDTLCLMYDVMPDGGPIELRPRYAISGFVRNILSMPIEGVSIVANNGGGNDFTDGTGYYEVEVSHGWSGNIEAVKADYTFQPAPAVYTNVIGDQTVDFIAQLDSDIDGSGNVGQPDLLILCENWLGPGDLSRGDLDGTGTVNLLDFAEFANVWLLQ